MTTIYTPDALLYDSATPCWVLRADYDFTLHRLDLDFTGADREDDGEDDGTATARTAVITDMNGNVVASGPLGDGLYHTLTLVGGGEIHLERLEIAGLLAGYMASAALRPGVRYREAAVSDATLDLRIEATLDAAGMAQMPGLAAGTELMTADGMVPVDWLRPGDRVLTRDHGFQPLLWVGRFDPAAAGAAETEDAVAAQPMVIEADAIAPGLPARPLTVAPRHRLLLQGGQLQLLFGHDAMFCAARDLAGWAGIAPAASGGGTVYTLLLPQHEAILADGLWAESLFLGDLDDGLVAEDRRAALHRLTGAPARHGYTAYPCLRDWEAQVLTPPARRETEGAASRAISRAV